MNIVFTNWILWPFLFLLTVPLILHLFARSRPPAYQFSSIEFILRIVRQTLRIRKPQDWLLLLLRTLLFAALVFIFLQPLFFSKRRLAGAFERKNVVLVVDATASMGYVDGVQTRFACACAHASEILSGLTARDTANIVWLKSHPESEFQAMGINMAGLQSALQRARVTAEAGNPTEAVRLSLDLLEGVEGHREICLISDFQKTTWANADMAVPQTVDLIKIKIGPVEAENGVISDLYADPPRPLVGEDVMICCEVRNYSSHPKRRTVFLSLPDSRQSQDVLVPAWGRSVATFRRSFASAGAAPVTVSLNEDVFPADDMRWTALDIREHLNVGLFAGEAETGGAWRRAIASLGWARLEPVTAEDFSASPPPDAIFVSGPLPAPPIRIHSLLARGCAVVWYPASNTTEFASSLVGELHAKPQWEEGETPHRLKIGTAGDPVFRQFAGGEYGDPAGGFARARLVIPASAYPENSVLLSYDDGIVALARLTASGNFFLWNLPLDRSLGNYSSRMEYVPLLGEMLLTSRVGAMPDASVVQEFLPGEQISRRIESDIPLNELKLISADDREIPVTLGGNTLDTALCAPVDPGIFSWRHRDRVAGYSVVNFPTAESDLRAFSIREIETPDAIGLTEGRIVRLLRDGVPLWPWLAAVAVAIMIMEGMALLWVKRS